MFIALLLCIQLNIQFPAVDNVDEYYISMSWFRQWEAFIKGHEEGMKIKTGHMHGVRAMVVMFERKPRG